MKDETTIPNRILALLIREAAPLTAEEITKRLGDVSRTAVNRALTKIKDRNQARFLGRTIGWIAATNNS